MKQSTLISTSTFPKRTGHLNFIISYVCYTVTVSEMEFIEYIINEVTTSFTMILSNISTNYTDI